MPSNSSFGKFLRSPRKRAITAYGLLLICISIFFISFLYYEYHQALDEGWDKVWNRADLAGEWVTSVFELSTMALEGLEELSHSPLTALSSDTVDIEYEQVERLLAERRARFPFLDELGLFDSDGRVVATSSPMFPRGYDLGGLPHFKVFPGTAGVRRMGLRALLDGFRATLFCDACSSP